jgi:membrane protease YdiL (CAAX protease family)
MRWWNGNQWTAHASAGPEAPPRAPEPAPLFPAAAARPLILGITASVVGARVFADLWDENFTTSPTLSLLALYVPLFAGLTYTTLLVSWRHGTGRVTTDFGWSFERRDIGTGALVYLVGTLASVLAQIPFSWVQSDHDPIDATFNSYFGSSWLAGLTLVLAAVVCAPMLEEIVFRGALQRALTGPLGVWGATTVQALCFGLYHCEPSLGRFNVVLVTSTAAFGFVAGVAATHWRHLGPCVVAHALTNAVYVLVTLTT